MRPVPARRLARMRRPEQRRGDQERGRSDDRRRQVRERCAQIAGIEGGEPMMSLVLAAALAALPKPPDELKAEKWFVGTWTCKGQQHAGVMGPEMKTGSKLSFKMDLAGFWLQVQIVATAGPMKGKEVVDGFATWDGTQHVRYDFQPASAWRLTSRGWEGDKLVFEGQAVTGEAKGPIRHTINRKGDNEFADVIEIDGKPQIERTCKRAGGATAQ